MEKQKNNGITLVLLIIFIITTILLGGYILYDKVLNNDINSDTNNEEVKENTNLTISDVTGQYTLTLNNLKSEDENFTTGTVTLNLYDNGIFTYIFSHYAPRGTLGNYIVEDNKIILTNWFNSNSDTGLPITKGTKTLTINKDGSISDNHVREYLIKDGITSFKLIKTSLPDESFNTFDLSSRLATGLINESYHEPNEPNM